VQVIAAYALFLFFVVVLIFFSIAFIVRRRKRAKAIKEKSALTGIEAGIKERLNAVCPDLEWRWECRPAGFAINGGIARIEVIYPDGTKAYMDVCVHVSGYLALHMANVVKLAKPKLPLQPTDTADSANDTVEVRVEANTSERSDKESVLKWYNIVLFGALTELIGNLHAKGEMCLNICQDGKAYVERRGRDVVVHSFGEMLNIGLWGHIVEKLGDDDLFAEIREGNRLFISWA